MSHGRKSGDGGSRFSGCSAGGAGLESSTGGAGAAQPGGGLFSFLKTELDSFVKGLNGKAEDAPPVPSKPSRPPTKRQKRSHNEFEEYEREMDAILQHTGGRLSDQDYAPLTEANLRASVSRLEVPGRHSHDERRNRPAETRDVVAAHSSYYAVEPPLDMLQSPKKPSLKIVTSPERRRRKRERAATFVNDEEARIQLRQQLEEQETRQRMEERHRQQRRREKEDRASRRRQDRAEALDRLQAQEELEARQEQEQMQAARDEEIERNSHLDARLKEEEMQAQAFRQERQDQEEYMTREKQARESLDAARERRRVAELEAEVERLRKELQETKAAQEQQHQQETIGYNRHVHFAPTPPLSDTCPGDISFLSISSISSLPPPPPPLPPPPPPIPSSVAKPSPLAVLTARKQSLKGKKLASNVGMPVDMSKFLNEMKDKKLKKVGLPQEGKKERRDDEEYGFKGILETVLKKRFHGERASGSTAASSSIPSLSSLRRLSSSTSSSITSFSDYRPPDWSMELDGAPFPPPRTSSLAKPALRKASSHIPQLSTSSLPAMPSRPIIQSTSKTSRTLSHPQAQSTPVQALRRNETPHHVSLLAKAHSKPQAAFGHALTSEEPQGASRVLAKRYAIPHSSMSFHPTPASNSAMLAIRDLPQPSTTSTERTRKTSAGSDNTANKSFRSAGSSFDIDIYANMQLKTGREGEDIEEEIAEEIRNSLENPVMTDGNMDYDPPPMQAVQRKPQATRIPTLRFSNVPLFGVSDIDVDMAEPSTRPILETERKISYYTHPREAPPPPPEKPSKDSLGRPLSPSKNRKRSKSSRVRLQEHDEMLLQGAEVTEQDASLILEGEESFLAGYGQRY